MEEEDNANLFKEMIGLSKEEYSRLNLNDKSMAWANKNINQLNLMAGNEPVDPTDPEARRLAEKAAAEQKKLLESAVSNDVQGSSGPKKNVDLSPLCKIRVKNNAEQVLRLTEAFLPRPDDAIRKRMDEYNARIMGPFRNTLDPKTAEARKRTLKSQLKAANERIKQRAKRPTELAPY